MKIRYICKWRLLTSRLLRDILNIFLIIYDGVMSKVYAQNAWIQLEEWCLTNGGCKLNIYQTLWIRESTAWQNSTELLVQDIFLSATFFVGTLATIWLLVSWLKMVFGGADESQFESGKKWVKYSIIGIILVLVSYTLIRVVEFVAQG